MTSHLHHLFPWLASLLLLRHTAMAAWASSAVDLHITNSTAICLDGTPGKMWLSTSSSTKWMIVLEGGGWCYSLADCYVRSLGPVGTSHFYTAPQNMNGPFDPNCDVNPKFCDYNIVQVHYCDGYSFMSDKGENSGLYFYGRTILQTALSVLKSTYNLDKATDVLLSGCSAGGTAAILNADYVHTELASITTLSTFKVLSLSGIFPITIANIDGDYVFADQIEVAVSSLVSNAISNIDSTCADALGSTDSWKCATAAGLYPYFQYPLMIVNSVYDKFSSSCIFGAKAVATTSTDNGNCSAFSSWEPCLGPNTNLNALSPFDTYSYFSVFAVNQSCSVNQVSQMNSQWRAGFMNVVQSADTFTKAGNAAFLHSCFLHCGSVWNGSNTGVNTARTLTVDTYNTIAIDDTTIYGAIGTWWDSDTTTPASENTYLSCEWWPEEYKSSQCNPSCPGYPYNSYSTARKVGIAVAAVIGVLVAGSLGGLISKFLPKYGWTHSPT